MIWPRILLAVVSVLIAIWFFRFAFTAQRKFRLIWLLPACLWVLSCLTLVFDPMPPKDITDVAAMMLYDMRVYGDCLKECEECNN